MPFQPSTREEIRQSLIDRIKQRSEGIKGFEERGINYVLVDAYAQYFVIYEHALLASQLSGWVDYSGGPVNEVGLRKLNIDPERTNLPLLNYFMDDGDLDALAAQNAITRSGGSRATGEVVMTLSDPEGAYIPSGTVVETAGTPTEEPLQFQTTEDVSPSGTDDTVTVEIVALEIGPDYNVGSGQITNFVNSPQGVESVTNELGTTGGEFRESNEELRRRVKTAMTANALGGTIQGVKGGLQFLFDGIGEGDVVVDESNLTVIVDGGQEYEVEQAIEDLRPVGINLTFSRPTIYTVDVDCTVEGSSINVNQVRDSIEDRIGEYGIGDDVDQFDVSVAVASREENVENATTIFTTEQTGQVQGDLQIGPKEKAVPGTINVTVA